MNNRRKLAQYSLFTILNALFFSLYTSPLHAWEGLQDDDVATIDSIPSLFSNILTAALSLVGLSTFIMIIIGGFKYLTSGDDPKATESAKSTITYGVIGLVLVVAAYFILIAISGFTGLPNLLKFQLSSS